MIDVDADLVGCTVRHLHAGRDLRGIVQNVSHRGDLESQPIMPDKSPGSIGEVPARW
jgi:hypothetical protein